MSQDITVTRWQRHDAGGRRWSVILKAMPTINIAAADPARLTYGAGKVYGGGSTACSRLVGGRGRTPANGMARFSTHDSGVGGANRGGGQWRRNDMDGTPEASEP